MADDNRHICIVEDDVAVREALARLIRVLGYEVHTFPSAEAFEADKPPGSCACLLLDVRLPGMSGIALHEKIRSRGISVPVVFLTGHGDVPMAVDAMKHGAKDFLTKPVDEEVMLKAIDQALAAHANDAEQAEECLAAKERLATLTPREREVMAEVVGGAPNKLIADTLSIAVTTVKIHRRRVMAKMAATSLVDLVRLAGLAGLATDCPIDS